MSDKELSGAAGMQGTHMIMVNSCTCPTCPCARQPARGDSLPSILDALCLLHSMSSLKA